MSLGIRLTWVLISSLSFIGCEIVHSFKTGQILGIKTTKHTSKIWLFENGNREVDWPRIWQSGKMAVGGYESAEMGHKIQFYCGIGMGGSHGGLPEKSIGPQSTGRRRHWPGEGESLQPQRLWPRQKEVTQNSGGKSELMCDGTVGASEAKRGKQKSNNEGLWASFYYLWVRS